MHMSMQLSDVECAEVDGPQFTMTPFRCRLQFAVPSLQRIAPDAPIDGGRSYTRSTANFRPEPLRVFGPVRPWHIEWLRLVVRKAVDYPHREAVEQ